MLVSYDRYSNNTEVRNHILTYPPISFSGICKGETVRKVSIQPRAGQVCMIRY